jgi:uncharacterized protein involved in tellurium resistance
MFGFGKDKKEEDKNTNYQPPTELPTPTAQADPAGGVSLTKGASTYLTKTALITITTTWNKGKDYDVMALVKYKDGHVETVCAVNNESPSTKDGAVKHRGDVGSTSDQPPTEVIEVRMNDAISEIVPFAYSAIENGAGSFKEYGVSVGVDNGAGSSVRIRAEEISSDRHRYTCAFARISNDENTQPPTVKIENIEQYSANHSEKRPAYVNGQLTMDAGVENKTK